MRRILVVANQTVGGEDLAAVIRARMAEGPCEFWLLVPATRPARVREDLAADVVVGTYAATPPQVGTDAYELVRRRLRAGLGRLRGLGATVQGDVGDGNALQAIEDAVARRQFDESSSPRCPAASPDG